MAMHGTSDPNNQDLVPTQLHRGDKVLGTDGQLGTVEQIVVDRDTGEQRAIVIRRGSDGAEFEVPVGQVKHLAPGELHLRLSRADLESRPDLARPYDPDQYVPVYPGDTSPEAEAGRTVQDTGHPVVTNVGQDAAELLVPQDVAATDTAVDAPTMPRTQAQPALTDTAVPIVGGNEPTRVLSRDSGTAGAGSDMMPRHVGPGETRAQMKSELTEGPPTEASPIESTTGELLGGRPTTGGMGVAAFPTSETMPPQDTPGTERDGTTLGAPGQHATRAGGGPAGGEAADTGMPPDLGRLSDDELSNPDAALATKPRPTTGAAVTLPFQMDTVAGEQLRGGSFPSDQAGMSDVFSKATNTAADDTWIEREPGALAEADDLPAGESGPRYDAADVKAAISAPAAENAAWRPGAVGAEVGGPIGTASAPKGTPAAPATLPVSDRSLRATLRAALRPNAPSQAAAEDEKQAMPPWVARVAAGLGASALLGGIAAGVVVARRNRTRTARRKAQKAAGTSSESIAATAASAIAKAQELADGMLKPAARLATDHAADTAMQVKRQARSSAREAKAQLKKGAAQAQENVQGAQKQVRKTAKRAARRARWFLRGLMLGAVAGVLFAPAPGEDLRSQLASRIEKVRSRIAS